MNELQEIEGRIAETGVLIENQRKKIEKLGFDRLDTTSPQIVFDSHCISLFLQVQERQRLREKLFVQAAYANIVVRLTGCAKLAGPGGFSAEPPCDVSAGL